MHELSLIHSTNRTMQRRVASVRPHVYQDGNSVTMQFQIGEIQSEMLMSDPNFLVLSYTRSMMAFLLVHPSPKRILMIGLGGGSMPKWCYRHLPTTDITVIEINPMVISVREEFHVPADDERFRVLCADGADYVATTEDAPEVLIVDGFDLHGQPPQLCSREFYEDCYRALAPDGVMVVNLCNPGHQQSIDQIRRTFGSRVLVVVPEDGENKVVFAAKDDCPWVEDEAVGEFMKQFQADDALLPSLVQG